MNSKINLLKHYRKYPKLQIEDIFKYIYQSAFGCEHLVSDEKFAVDYIRREFSETEILKNTEIEALDGEYSRVPLSLLSEGMSAETLGKIFCLSSKKELCGMEKLLEKLRAARELVISGELPFSLCEFDKRVALWKDGGYKAVHHSDAFRFEYSPHYRVISNRFVPFLRFFAKVDKLVQKGDAIIAIEGGSASGKTTLASVLSQIYDCNIFHMDDFFLRPEQRTPERFAEAGGNVDRERFFDEVLLPLSEKREVCYRKFDCSTQTLDSPVSVAPKKLTFVEGAYSMHPMLQKYYDFSLFLDVAPGCQRKRILVRNSPEFAKRFFEEWIPYENHYFSKTNIKERCSMTVIIDF